MNMGDMIGTVFKYGIVFSIPVCIVTIIVNLLIRKRKQIGTAAILYRCLFTAYCCFLLTAVFVGRPRVQGAMLIPFSSYYEAWITRSFIGWRNILINIAMFIPFGILFPVAWSKNIKLKNFALIAGVATLSIEIVQYVSKKGLFEVDDLINNLIGALIGFLIWNCLFQNVGKVTNVKYTK